MVSMIGRIRIGRLSTLSALVLLGSSRMVAGAVGNVSHLTVYEAGVGEFLESRTVELQPGLNTVEWRSIMPQAHVRTIRVTAENAEVVRQDVSYDGALAGNERSPVLHLTIRNPGAAGPRRVQVDYLAPGMGWQADYALVLDPTANGAPPTSGRLDCWVSVRNQTSADIAAGVLDLVAGEISLLVGAGQSRGDSMQMQSMNAFRATEPEWEPAPTTVEGSGIGSVHRFRLGRDLTMNANSPISRFPLLQGARVGITQRNVFENEYGTQTLARGGFVLLPRGLEVRLVSKNAGESPLPAGQVTTYGQASEALQIVGQDRIPLTPANAEWGVSQGRSATLFGTRRILERRQVPYRREDGNSREKLVTRVEVVLTNRGALAAEAIVREGIEAYGDNQWSVTASSGESDRLGSNTLQFRLEVPAKSTMAVSYTVETK